MLFPGVGRVPFDQNFRKSWFKIEWNRKFPEICFENFGAPLKVAFFSRNLEIPEISCSISTQYESAPVPLISCEKVEGDGESRRHYTGDKVICRSSNLFLIAYPPQKR